MRATRWSGRIATITGIALIAVSTAYAGFKAATILARDRIPPTNFVDIRLGRGRETGGRQRTPNHQSKQILHHNESIKVNIQG
jgi:hypothetical protein